MLRVHPDDWERVSAARLSSVVFMRALAGSFGNTQDHGPPQIWNPTRAVKLHVLCIEISLGQQTDQGLPAPELDMPAFESRRMVGIPLVRQTDDQILEISVIWRRANQPASRFKRIEASRRPTPGGVEVFDHFEAQNQIERLFAQLITNILIDLDALEADFGMGPRGLVDSSFGSVYSNRGTPLLREAACPESVPATHVQHAAPGATREATG